MPNASLAWCLLTMYAVSLAAYGLGRRAGSVAERQPWRRWLWLACAGYTALFCAVTFTRYDRVLSGLCDLGIFDSAVWNVTRGRLFWDFRGPYDHFSPVLLLCGPVYWLWPHAKSLLFIQTIALATGALPLYAFARHKLGNDREAFLWAAVYLLCPFLWRVNLYDFHAVCFLPVLFFSCCLALERGKMGLFFALVVACLCVKEGVAILVIALGVFAGTQRRSLRLAAALIVLGLIWGWAVAKVYYPHVVGQPFPHYGRYSDVLANGLSGAPQALARRVAGSFGAYYAWATVLLVFLPVGLMPFFSSRAFLCLALVPLLEQLSSNYIGQRLLKGHYPMSIVVGVMVASVYGYHGAFGRRPPGAGSRRGAFWYVASCAVLSAVFFGDPPFERHYQIATQYDLRKHMGLMSQLFRPDAWRQTKHHRILHAFRRLIPRSRSVMAQNSLGAYFTQRDELHEIKLNLDADFYLFDAETRRGHTDPKRYNTVFDSVARRPDYELLFAEDGFYFFCRKGLSAEVWARATSLAEESRDPLYRHIADAIRGRSGF